MLRAVSSIYIESQTLELLSAARRDVFKLFRTSPLSTQVTAAALPGRTQTVLSTSSRVSEGVLPPPPRGLSAESSPPPPPPPPPPYPPPRREWHVPAAALALTASLGGVYYYRKLNEDNSIRLPIDSSQPAERGERGAWGPGEESPPPPEPRSGSELPEHVQFLLVGAGTASFAAMRAIRAARPDAQVLLVGEEPELPYMRPPLSKELWREPELAERALEPDSLTFRQWNGRRRSVTYEPAAFYTAVGRLARGEGGAGVARGWRVERLHVARHAAELRAVGAGDTDTVTVTYDKCLVATGARARLAPALRGARDAGRVLSVRSVRDAARLARWVARDEVRHVAVLGGGLLAAELGAALAGRPQPEGRRVAVTQLFREAAPLAGLLPRYLADDVARTLGDAGVALVPRAEVVSSGVEAGPGAGPGAGAGGAVRLRLAGGAELRADLVVECVGAEPDTELARRSQLETHDQLGGVLVNAELQARTDVFAAGDVACFYDVALGRRRVEHHDHAVVSGRLAGQNMAARSPHALAAYTHQSMFWSDLGPHRGFEAIGIIDSRLPTVGVFSTEAVSPAAKSLAASGADSAERADEPSGADSAERADEPSGARRYERGVVFYVREKRVVGVLLWNLFNRMHVARQVLAHGEFDDLFEVAKLFALHEDE